MTKERSAPAGETCHSLKDASALTVGTIMSADVVTAAPDDTISSVAEKMTQNHISCVVVVENAQVTGVFTERDVVRGLAACGPKLGLMKVSERMSSPVEIVQPCVRVLDASRIMESISVKRLPVVVNEELVGIVTKTDVTRGLTLLTPQRSVRDIMSKDVATVDAQATVAEATQIMSQRDSACVVALREGAAVGILTEKDLARSVAATQSDPAGLKVCDVMSSPIIGVPSTCCIHHASRKMSAMRLHRLVVTNEGTICGIVSQSDIIKAVRDELEQADIERERTMAAIAGHVQNAMNQLTQLREDLVRRSSESANDHDTTGNTAKDLSWAMETAAGMERVISELAQL